LIVISETVHSARISSNSSSSSTVPQIFSSVPWPSTGISPAAARSGPSPSTSTLRRLLQQGKLAQSTSRRQPRSKLSSPGSLSRRRAQRLRSQRGSTIASCSASRTHRTPGARRPRAGHKNRQKEAEAGAAAAAGRSCRTSTGSVTKVFPTGVALGGHKVFPWQGSARRFAEEREGSAREGKRAREKGSTRAGSSDGERRGMGKDASRLSRDGEGESHLMSLADLLEASFNTCLLFLAIHSHLQ